MIAEDAYGTAKRLAFVSSVLRANGARRVVDVGCGTGTALTKPLALEFPQTEFLGLEPDARTRTLADSQNILPNLRFADWPDLPPGPRFDVVIASEVLEHVEDPVAFLRSLRELVNDSGRVVLTFPNGWGPFELASMAANWWRVFVQRQVAAPPASGDAGDLSCNTLAESPHINFFRWGAVSRLLRWGGLEVESYRGRTFLCGPGLNKAVDVAPRRAWNARIADTLPPQFVSGWMFIARPTQPVSGRFRRGPFQRIHRQLNERSGRVPEHGS